MKIKNNYIVSVLVCAVLFLASCAEETLVDNPHAQNAFRTVSVDLGMPQGKPAYGDGTDSRAQMADTTATGYRLSFDTAETGKPDASRAGSNNWINGDKLLLHIVASNEDQPTQTTEGMLTLTYSDSKWSLDAMNSYTKYGASFVDYNSAQPKLLITDDDTDIDLANLKMQVDEKIGVSANVTATLFYAPHMKWSPTEGSVTLVVDETASTYEKWEWTNTTSSWTTPYARLRVNTGNGNAGDVVTLTSSAFDSACEVEPTEGEGENAKTVYTATTDAEGNAYFYGITNGTLTDNFLVELTQMRVPVPTAAPASEGRSITLEDESTLLIDLDEPITLLEASDVVPVTLAATHAYKLVAEDKRNTAMTENINSLSVIDGQCGITEVTDGLYYGTVGDVAAVKAQIETAVAAGITEFTVINQLAVYPGNTVVGMAINQFGVSNSGTKISLTLADATEVIDGAFYECTALKSVSAPAATEINQYAFFGCTALERVSAPYLKKIRNFAFDGCENLESVTMDEVTHIYSMAFNGCTDLTTVNLNKVIYIGEYAFSGLQLTDLEIGENAASDEHISLDPKAFSDCTLTGSVKFHKVVGYGSDVVDGLTQKNAFEGVATSELDLFLHAEQPIAQISVSNDGKLMWAGAEWKSIKVGETEYTAVGDVLCSITNGVPTTVIDDVTYAVIDGSVGGKTQGTSDDMVAMKNQIEAALNLPAPITNFYVMNGLAAYPSIYAKTVVGEAIRQITSGSVSLLLDDVITTLPDNAFRQCTTLTSVTTAATTLGNSAFNECSALESVNLTATSNIAIEIYAFSHCAALTNVMLPQNVNTTIGDFAFSYTSNLATINLEYVTSIGQRAFEYSGITNVNTPATLMDNGSGMSFTFYQCTNLKTVILSGATTIPNKAFSDCINLEDVTLSAATTLGLQAFAYCDSFKSFTAGAVITNANTSNSANNSFSNVTTNCALTLHADQLNQTGNLTVSVSNGKLMWAGKQWKSITMGDRVYTQMNGFVKLEKDNVTYAVIDGSLTDSQAVNNQVTTALAAGIYNLYVANGLAVASNLASEIGTYVGDAIYQLTSEVTPFSTEMVNYNGKISLLLDNQITVIPESAFFDCYALKSVSAPGAYQIGNAAFESCINLQSVEIGENADGEITIGEYAFQNDANLGVIKFYKVVTSVGNEAFNGVNHQSCNLFLNKNQTYGELNGYEWCGVTWRSITYWP